MYLVLLEYTLYCTPLYARQTPHGASHASGSLIDVEVPGHHFDEAFAFDKLLEVVVGELLLVSLVVDGYIDFNLRLMESGGRRNTLLSTDTYIFWRVHFESS